jgi:hypothetical protein
MRNFRRQPIPGLYSKPGQRSLRGSHQLTPEIQGFKNTYILERRVLEQFRHGGVSHYTPSPNFDGLKQFNTPEEPERQNAWIKAYAKIQSAQSIAPAYYLRLLFRVLRGSALTVPTVQQLASSVWFDLVREHVNASKTELRQQYIAESQRARSAVVRLQKGAGHTLSLSVYYAIADDRLELSPLFRYCLAISTSEKIQATDKNDLHCAKLEKLGERYKFLAAMDYTLFPDLYDEAGGSVIPPGFRAAANRLLEESILAVSGV